MNKRVGLGGLAACVLVALVFLLVGLLSNNQSDAQTATHPPQGARRAFQSFTLLDLSNDRFFSLLVDLKDHAVVEDVAAIQQAEEATVVAPR